MVIRKEVKIMERNSYEVVLEDIVCRRAKDTDNMREIAELMYQTDPYIYPFWFKNDITKGVNYIADRMKSEGFFFHYNNIYIAYDKYTNKILGAICAVDNTVNLDYDYTQDMKIDYNFEFTIKNYILALVEEVKNNNYIYISNVCVNPNYRSNRIGTKILGHFISQMEKAGWDEFALDCLLHNLRAKNLYHSLGFKEIKEIVGFDGTNHSTVEVVSFLRKNSDYLPYEFQSVNINK